MRISRFTERSLRKLKLRVIGERKKHGSGAPDGKGSKSGLSLQGGSRGSGSDSEGVAPS